MESQFEKWAKRLIILMIVVGLPLAFFNRHRLKTYEKQFEGKLPDVQVRYADLSSAMDEAAVMAHFQGLPFACYNESFNLGDRICHAEINKADGLGALTIVAVFRKQHLAHLIVQVPWWRHGSWLDSLKARYGEPQEAGIVSIFEGPVWRWTVLGGMIEFNRDKSWNPLEWSVAFWTPDSAASR